MIHGTGIFTYIYHKNQPNVGKYTVRPMDAMGNGWFGLILEISFSKGRWYFQVNLGTCFQGTTYVPVFFGFVTPQKSNELIPRMTPFLKGPVTGFPNPHVGALQPLDFPGCILQFDLAKTDPLEAENSCHGR